MKARRITSIESRRRSACRSGTQPPRGALERVALTRLPKVVVRQPAAAQHGGTDLNGTPNLSLQRELAAQSVEQIREDADGSADRL